jgi:membrane-associated phospholipid phosphatase
VLATTTRRIAGIAGAVAVFIVLSWAASSPTMHRWDQDVTVWLQRSAPSFDLSAGIVVFLGNAEVLIPCTALGALILFARHRDGAIPGLWLAAGLAISALVAVGFKSLIVHPGPPPAFQRPELHIGLSVPTPYSFPSGHTLRTTILAGTVLRRIPWLAGLSVLGMMTALVYLGDHWMSDVLGGLCLGWVALEIAAAARGRLDSRSAPPKFGNGSRGMDVRGLSEAGVRRCDAKVGRGPTGHA